ncbi:MAG: hypothetical protein NUK63_00325 [Candidatus Bathyarchaeum tardum]|nr:MAG: hypothetical protein NUK63_00325 [Candidatus Bathyarchaeum tardum]
MFRRLRNDRRGVSNIIVVALSLVIMLAIVSDIVLWDYEMTQADWEKMKENVAIVNTKSSTTALWLTAQSEYTVNTGTKTSGTYTATASIDGSFASFTEGLDTNNVTLINNESFEAEWPPAGWSATGNWNKKNEYQHDGTYSAQFDGFSSGGGQSGYLYSPILNCSDAEIIYVEFWWYDHRLDNDDFILQYYDGSTWDTIQDLNLLESANGWHHYSQTVTDSQYFVSNFQIRWWAKTVGTNEIACVDEVTIKKRSTTATYAFDITGDFFVDLSDYQMNHIQTIELQLIYRASDAGEKWYLQAYNWSSSTYSNNGFNVTAGHAPTTGWDYYTVNFTDVWQDYVDVDGTINVKLLDEGGDIDQTSIDIDFLGINVKTTGTQFTFKNQGSLTVRLVSLWVSNSTTHQRYDIDVFLNSGATKNYVSFDVELPPENYVVKVITERGNSAIFSEN